MDITTQTNTLKILNSLITRKTAVKRRVHPYALRPKFQYTSDDCIQASPESVGISSGYIHDFYTSLLSEPTLDMQTVTIARKGKIISSAQCFPYRCDIPHISHSLCKSIVSLAIGILYDRGLISLNEKITDIFPEKRARASVAFKSKLTVYHLLTMTSGAIFNEAGSLSDKNWLKAFLENGAKFAPGHQFEYNSMNTYVLSAIICKKTRSSLSEFAEKNIFSPLGIKTFYWEKCPMGIEKGGWGLYTKPSDTAKLGYLMLQNGMYNGQRIVSEKWIKLATKPHIKTPPITGSYDYGFQMWIDEKHDEVLFNGMFGQNLHIFRKTKTVVMTTAGNGDIFQRCRAYNIIQRYFGKKFRPSSILEESPDMLSALRNAEKCLYKKNTLEESIVTQDIADPTGFISRSDKLSYITDRAESIGVSIFPSIAQTVHNTFSDGIEKISFSFENGSYFVTFRESAGIFKLKVGFDNAEYQTIHYNSEPYAAAVYAEAVTNEDRLDVLKLTVAYPELPNKKHFKIYFHDRSLVIKSYETPGYDFAITALSMIAADSINDILIKPVGGKITKEVEKAAEHFLCPTVHASPTM